MAFVENKLELMGVGCRDVGLLVVKKHLMRCIIAYYCFIVHVCISHTYDSYFNLSAV